jgi:CHAD domain-containing protein
MRTTTIFGRAGSIVNTGHGDHAGRSAERLEWRRENGVRPDRGISGNPRTLRRRGGMGFRFKRKESIRDGVRRIADEQIGRALRDLDDPELSAAQKVHQLRKRCKKLRGLIRLVRPGFEEVYRHENAWFRDTARPLSRVRDSKSVIDAFDGLMKQLGDREDFAVFEPIRLELSARRDRMKDDAIDLPERLAAARERMRQAGDRVADWGGDLDRKALAAGLAKTYGRCRQALRQAERSSTPEALHEWRKRVKYHWYHTRLMERAWSPLLSAAGEVGKDIADLLGDDHDLAVLQTTLKNDLEAFGGPPLVESLSGLIDRRRRKLEQHAIRSGRRLFCEKPKRFTARWMHYWDDWRS